MWTAERILALAPDPASAKAGQGLSSARKWVSHGHNAAAMWGECQGSGKDPYKTQIDLSEPAFKCSCPSRKFPCKHALGLFLMLGPAAGSMEDAPPEWVKEWLATRGAKVAKKQEKLDKIASGEAPVDAEAQAKRAAQRLAKIAAGVEDISRWMQDLVRSGLAHGQTAGENFWREPAARLVDAQAPGLGRMVREIGDAVATGEGWQERALKKLCRAYLLAEAFKRLEKLPAELQADVKAMVGIALKEEELVRMAVGEAKAGDGIPGAAETTAASATNAGNNISGTPPNATPTTTPGNAIPGFQYIVADEWRVLGQRTEEDEGLRTQRSWLLGRQTGRAALILEFAFGGQPLKSTLVIGTEFAGELIFYPSAYPLRAMIKSRAGDTREARVEESGGFAQIEAALEAYSDGIAKNPFVEAFPLLLSRVRLVNNQRMLAVDAAANAIRLHPRSERGWEMVALAGGQPVMLFGEWDGSMLSPMAMVVRAEGGKEALYGLG